MRFKYVACTDLQTSCINIKRKRFMHWFNLSIVTNMKKRSKERTIIIIVLRLINKRLCSSVG